jgi:hypothetical protein
MHDSETPGSNLHSNPTTSLLITYLLWLSQIAGACYLSHCIWQHQRTTSPIDGKLEANWPAEANQAQSGHSGPSTGFQNMHGSTMISLQHTLLERIVIVLKVQHVAPRFSFTLPVPGSSRRLNAYPCCLVADPGQPLMPALQCLAVSP